MICNARGINLARREWGERSEQRHTDGVVQQVRDRPRNVRLRSNGQVANALGSDE